MNLLNKLKKKFLLASAGLMLLTSCSQEPRLPELTIKNWLYEEPFHLNVFYNHFIEHKDYVTIDEIKEEPVEELTDIANCAFNLLHPKTKKYFEDVKWAWEDLLATRGGKHHWNAKKRGQIIGLRPVNYQRDFLEYVETAVHEVIHNIELKNGLDPKVKPQAEKVLQRAENLKAINLDYYFDNVDNINYAQVFKFWAYSTYSKEKYLKREALANSWDSFFNKNNGISTKGFITKGKGIPKEFVQFYKEFLNEDKEGNLYIEIKNGDHFERRTIDSEGHVIKEETSTKSAEINYYQDKLRVHTIKEDSSPKVKAELYAYTGNETPKADKITVKCEDYEGDGIYDRYYIKNSNVSPSTYYQNCSQPLSYFKNKLLDGSYPELYFEE
jgi:hypothetical protein